MTEKKEDEKIEIVKLHRQVQVSKPEFQVMLSSECISEDMNYLTNKAKDILDKYCNSR